MKIYLILPFFLFGCLFKTADQIKREKLVDQMSIQVLELQKQNSEITGRMDNIEKQIAQLNGLLEETGHEKEQLYLKGIQELKSDIDLLKGENQNTQEILKKNEAELSSQKQFITQVLNTLDKLSKPEPKKKVKNPYDEAMANYKSGRYNLAQKQLLTLIDDKTIKGNMKARIIHNLGMISYINKSYQDALIYFGQLFTQYPKAPYNPNGLLYLAKSFQKLNQIEQCKQSLQQLINTYPNHARAKEARELLKKLK